RNAAPSGAAEGTGGAIAVLWLPEHAPTVTGSFPVLRMADQRQPSD
ncbi:two-component sensor histidine kinase, partial [Streptomyces sp. SID7982]|nr:two-component sensor histidine kinase [Streptomyces sp. SID7982]